MKHNIRVRGGFSDRNSLSPIPKTIQFDSFTSETRIVLFNSLKNIVLHQIGSVGYDSNSISKIVVENLFNEVYTDKYDFSFEKVMDDILEAFKNEEYHIVLTIIEFMCNLVYEPLEDYAAFAAGGYYDTRAKMNDSFEEEYVGYRFIGDKIVPITNDGEIDTITQSFETPYESVNKSILKSLSFISETGNKDYKNAIKESIVAVEQLLNILLNTQGLVLSNAVEQLCQRVEMNEHLKASIKELYKFACDVNGIRHGNNKKEEEISFDEAKYVLLICSSTINYLVLKYQHLMVDTDYR